MYRYVRDLKIYVYIGVNLYEGINISICMYAWDCNSTVNGRSLFRVKPPGKALKTNLSPGSNLAGASIVTD